MILETDGNFSVNVNLHLCKRLGKTVMILSSKQFLTLYILWTRTIGCGGEIFGHYMGSVEELHHEEFEFLLICSNNPVLESTKTS